MAKCILIALFLYLLSFSVTSSLLTVAQINRANIEKEYAELKDNPKYSDIISKITHERFSQARVAAQELVRQQPHDYGAHLLLLLTAFATNDIRVTTEYFNTLPMEADGFEIPLR